MDPLETVVAGLSCRQVLGHLGDYVDGDLPSEVLAQVRAHLAGCDTCDRFGGRVATLVASLRGAVGVMEEVPADALARLGARLQETSGR